MYEGGDGADGDVASIVIGSVFPELELVHTLFKVEEAVDQHSLFH